MGQKLLLRGYATHRKSLGLPGGNLSAVQKAIASGRITTDAAGKIDPDRADAAWAALTAARPGASATDAAQTNRAAPPAQDPVVDEEAPAQEARQREGAAGGNAQQNSGLVFQRARAMREVTNARIAEVKLEKLRGNTLDRTLVLDAWARQITNARTRLLGIPTKLRTRAPHFTAADLALINDQIEEVLKELATARKSDDDGSD